MILDWTIKFGDILTIVSLLGMALAFTWSARSVLAKIEITESTIGLRLKNLEGDMRANPGDWIIRGVKGEFYPCKPDIFEATYEPV